MTGEALTDRLIDDLNKTAKTRSEVADPFTQIKMLGATGNADMKSFISALNIGSADAHIDILSQFINFRENEQYVDHKKGDKVDITVFQRDVTNNRDSISQLFQEIIDNKDMKDMQSQKPISYFLIEQLDWIHEAASK